MADVGIALGSGSKFLAPEVLSSRRHTDCVSGDVAISSASFVILASDLNSIMTLTDLARVVINRVKFNFVSLILIFTLFIVSDFDDQIWAAMYNIAALPIAAGVIYPAGHARLSPVWASLAMALS
jgi:P-type Cu+ transporter